MENFLCLSKEKVVQNGKLFYKYLVCSFPFGKAVIIPVFFFFPFLTVRNNLSQGLA
ncbi:hypothetical protein HMPREF1981_02092 [Bacteroides pyogenes F0041]|uniref:Uncharacterized protein n=1 Tax=Bacteroides pyogenes F0041 TaxID=1321819 RepID=U2C3H9_9BACE|nr:hypothetical protein HMPREF1981_02092 [Bacteroides pyogenes F0041]